MTLLDIGAIVACIAFVGSILAARSLCMRFDQWEGRRLRSRTRDGSGKPSGAGDRRSSMVADPVNHPAHYTSDPSGVECIQITRHRNFNVGNAIKYLWRAGLKDEATHIEDLRKAAWYIEDEINRLAGSVDGH